MAKAPEQNVYLGHPNPLCIKMGLKWIPLEQVFGLNDPRKYRHAVHCLLYCKKTDQDGRGYFGLGQVRFDGLIGFPGGVVGDGEEPLNTVDDLLHGLRRELWEEINFVTADGNEGFQHVSSYFNDKANPVGCKNVTCNVFHFFRKEITEQEFVQCELNHTKSIHFPVESMGIFRIPLIDPVHCGTKSIFRFYCDKGGFLINFFAHNFAGKTRQSIRK